MKKILLPLLSAALVGTLLFSSSCDDPESDGCKISTFVWEGQNYTLVYSGDRLDRMVDSDSHVDLTYDEMDRLYTAQFFLPGDGATPSYDYTFLHGPNGITQIDQYSGGYHSRRLFHYTPSGDVDYMINQEFGGLSDPTEVTFEIRRDLTFDSNGNLTFVDGTSSVITTEYTIDQYDHEVNPFKMLAAAVNNPKFFPLGVFANFPVASYDVSLGSRFSENNPHYARYQLPSVDPNEQEFIHTYTGTYTTSIAWNSDEYGSITTEYYEFNYSCGTD